MKLEDKAMSKLEDLIQQYCSDGVEYMPIKNVSQVKRGERLTKSALKEDGEFIVVSGGVSPMGRYTNYNRNENTITISSYGAAGYIGFQTEKFWANDVCLSVFPNEIIDNKYLFYALKKEQNYLYSKTTKAIPDHIPTEVILDLEIPVPPLAVQEEIVRILDNFTTLTAELQAELQARQRQYEHYRDHLLSFGGDDNPHSNDTDPIGQHHKPLNISVEWKKLGDIATVTKLAGFEFTNYVKYSDTGNIIALRGLNVKDGHLVLDDLKYIDNSDFSKLSRSKLYRGDLLYTYVGTVGQVGLVDEDDKYYLAPNVALIRVNNGVITSKFLIYFLLSNIFKSSQLEKLTSSSSMKNITMEKIRTFAIPIPPLAEQQRIVDILDRFDALVNDISTGLPAEIEARRKQYEYYRDKLLSFKEAK